MRPRFVVAITSHIAMFSVVMFSVGFADQENWESSCCYCLTAQTSTLVMPRCEEAAEQICQELMPDPDDCDTIPPVAGGVPSGGSAGNGGGSDPGGGPCCATCYCFPFFGVTQEVELEELLESGNLSGHGNVDQLAKLVYDHAERRRELGDSDAAHKLFDVAGEMYLHAISQQFSKGRGFVYGQDLLSHLGYFANASADTTAIAQALESVSPRFSKHFNVADGSARIDELQQNKLVQLFHDYQSCVTQSADMSSNPLQKETAKSVLEATVWGSQIESTSPYKSLHFEAMGSALVLLDRYSDAASAYAAAWQGGFQSPIVLENYRYARSLAENRVLQMSPDIQREIAISPAIEGVRLREIIIELSR